MSGLSKHVIEILVWSTVVSDVYFVFESNMELVVNIAKELWLSMSFHNSSRHDTTRHLVSQIVRQVQQLASLRAAFPFGKT